jgi:two-component system, NtrC family, sensor histidine kinase HydH
MDEKSAAKHTTIAEYLRHERPVVIILIALYLVLSLAAILLIRGEHHRARLLLEYRLERISSALLESYRSEPLSDGLDEEISGFGVYHAGGVAVTTFGDAPASITIPAPNRETTVFTIDYDTSTMTMIRPIGLIGMAGRPGMPGMTTRRPATATYLFVRVRSDDIARQRAAIFVTYLVALAAIAALFAVIGGLQYRNWLYRTRIDSQRNLVHLGEAARTIAHEIRNPLSAVRIQTGILRRVLDPEWRENLDVIDEETGRINDLVDRIRDFLHHPSGEPTDVDARELVEEIAARYGWNVDFDGDSRLVPVRFDHDRLRSVLENLLRNGIEASAPGDPVTVRFERLRSKLRITISDRGVGLPEHSADRLFDPFFTTKERGSGIGLAIAKRFVEAAGGTLAVRPATSKGTEAVVTLVAGNRDVYHSVGRDADEGAS